MVNAAKDLVFAEYKRVVQMLETTEARPYIHYHHVYTVISYSLKKTEPTNALQKPDCSPIHSIEIQEKAR